MFNGFTFAVIASKNLLWALPLPIFLHISCTAAGQPLQRFNSARFPFAPKSTLLINATAATSESENFKSSLVINVKLPKEA
ncbi:unannotated protein [freshwater metagenome]|uniref:Unannotated protein n=1 Tax=freshwater metagenome TaxID=449393 RepID=A0A6J6LN12_9ZZZZ